MAVTDRLSFFAIEHTRSRRNTYHDKTMALSVITNTSESSVCFCVAGYTCRCNGRKTGPRSVKRKYTSSGRPAKQAKPSTLMEKRLVPAVAHPDILAKIHKGCCKTGNCLMRLYKGRASSQSTHPDLYGWDGIPSEGYGSKLLTAVELARKHVYHTGQLASRSELKNLLQRDVSSNMVGDIRYKFYHEGVLGNAPAVPIGIRVRSNFINTLLKY